MEKDLFAMLFERGNAMQTFWGFYITVAGVLIAFFGSAQRSRLLAAVLSGAFIAFAVVNADGMHSIAEQRKALYELVSAGNMIAAQSDFWKSAVDPYAARVHLVDASKPPDPVDVAAFHILSDFAVLAAIWLLTVFPRDQPKTPQGDVAPAGSA